MPCRENALSREVHAALSETELRNMHTALPADTVLLEQRHCDLVTVPIGWLHAVANVQPNIKLAHDRLLYADIHKVAHIHTTLVSPRFGPKMADDYCAAMPHLVQEMRTVHEILTRAMAQRVGGSSG